MPGPSFARHSIASARRHGPPPKSRAGRVAELRRAAEREQEQLKTAARAGEQGLAELRLAFDRERNDLMARLTVRENELAALRTVSERENGALSAKVAELE